MKKRHFINLPNTINIIRVILVFVVVYFLLSKNNKFYLIASALMVFVIFLDYLDGLAARKFNSVTGFGGILDIIGDRIVENVLWVTFAYLNTIPLWIPLVVITRSFVTDGIRNYAFSKGKTAFGKKTMMKSKLSMFLVSSRISRAIYAIAKAITFSLLSIQIYLSNILYPNVEIFSIITFNFVIFTVALCIIRGLYVIVDGLNLSNGKGN